MEDLLAQIPDFAFAAEEVRGDVRQFGFAQEFEIDRLPNRISGVGDEPLVFFDRWNCPVKMRSAAI